LRKFQVSVNGTKYVVEVEELSEAQSVTPAAATPAAPQPVAASAPEAPTAPVAQGVAEGVEIKAPLRGQIMSVLVKVGDKVAKNQLLCTIEALKLENEISSPVAGTVTGVFTHVGHAANTGDVLMTIKED
jgi:biotin carboxyl carrier protein